MNKEILNFGALSRIVITGLVVYLAWKGLAMLMVLLIAVIISMALHPIAVKISQKLPWWLAVLLVIMVLLIPIITIIVFIAVAFTSQLSQVVESIRVLIDSFSFIPQSIKEINILETLQSNAGYVFDSTKTILTIIGSIITVIITSFYLIYDQVALSDLVLDIFPQEKKKILQEMFTEITKVVGHYIRGNLIVSTICATVIFIGLSLLNVPFAVPLAIFTGIAGLLPYIGPLIGLVPAAILGLSVSPLTGLFVVVLYLVYQQIENTFIIPIVYNKALNLSPALVFLSVIIGAGLFGVLGAFLALPVAASIPVLIKYAKKFQKDITI
jgi:predicted PurR-regulated permease PerM